MDLKERNEWLALDDEALAKQCHIDTCRGTGPGGQKRNKTSSMVRLLPEPGIKYKATMRPDSAAAETPTNL